MMKKNMNKKKLLLKYKLCTKVKWLEDKLNKKNNKYRYYKNKMKQQLIFKQDGKAKRQERK
jgi:hypothetical protein